MKTAFKFTKKLFITIVGITVLVVGLLFLVLPGPGLLVIIAGLIILASEFAWARSALETTKGHYDKAKSRIKNIRNNKTDQP